MKKLSRLGTDGALVMAGCHNGFAVWLQRVNVKTFSVWCVAPKITLVVRWASKAVPDLVYQIANLNPAKITGTAAGIRNHGTENLERLIERYADASEEESLIDADEVRNSFIQFKQFLKSNEDNPLKELREILAKPGVYEDIFPSFVTLTQVFQTIPLTSVPCERYFSAQNRIHGALRNKMSPSAVECKMHISYAYKRHVDEESFGDRAVKKFNKMKNRRK